MISPMVHGLTTFSGGPLKYGLPKRSYVVTVCVRSGFLLGVTRCYPKRNYTGGSV